MDQCLGDIEFRPLESDPCEYVYEDEVGFVFLTLYVDDLLLLGANKLLSGTQQTQESTDGSVRDDGQE